MFVVGSQCFSTVMLFFHVCSLLLVLNLTSKMVIGANCHPKVSNLIHSPHQSLHQRDEPSWLQSPGREALQNAAKDREQGQKTGTVKLG